MKKLVSFLRSMRFGIILLALILLCSVAGSVIPQGEQAEYYRNYYSWSEALLILKLDDIFSSWYFLALMALLCLNLTLCSLTRFNNVRSAAKNAVSRALAVSDTHTLNESERQKFIPLLKGFRKKEHGEVTVYSKNTFGFYGSFVTHLAILMTLVFAALSLYASVYQTFLIPVGETRTLEDGTVLAVEDFRIFDEKGDISYVSTVKVTDASGRESEPADISVNFPFSFAGHKFYQQEYRAQGRITVTNIATGAGEAVTVDEECFLSLDGKNGMMYQALYPGFTEIDGMRMPMSGGNYTSPAYIVAIISDKSEQRVLIPGESVEAGGVRFTMESPGFYPGIRVKTIPAILIWMLYLSFCVMIAGLWMCFFSVPIFVVLRNDCYSLYSSKSTYGFQLAANAALGEKE